MSVIEPQDCAVSVKDLPITFKVKYLGSENAKGLWGIKYIRRPVDHLVSVAKTLPPNNVLSICDLTVSLEGVLIEKCTTPKSNQSLKFTIDTISYGVQDLVYTRVFAMIIVKESCNIQEEHPFEVHAFVCDNRSIARKLTYALASAFQEYSKKVKSAEEGNQSNVNTGTRTRKQFAIELRTPEELQRDYEDEETEA